MITLHSIGVRVYYEDTDAGGIVYYANYLRFFERARTDWLRAAGISHQELSQVEGLNLVVRDCTVHYLRPARLDDLLAVEVSVANPVTDIGRASLRLTQRALLVERALDGGAQAAAGEDAGATGRAQAVLATGTVRVACVDRASGRPVALPQRVMRLIAAQVHGRVLGQIAGQDSVAQGQGQGSMQASKTISTQVSTRVTPDGTAEQQ